MSDYNVEEIVYQLICVNGEMSLLMEYIDRGNIDGVKRLVKSNPDILNAKLNHKGDNALDYSIRKKQKIIIEYLKISSKY